MGDKIRFEAEVVEGHKGVLAVIVPFNPETAWKRKPVRLHGRRHGWVVRGSAGKRRFEGYVGERWGRFFVMLDGVEAGERLRVELEPLDSRAAYEAAVEQSKRSTQPRKARADAVAFGEPQHG